MAILGSFVDSQNKTNTIETNSYLHEQSTLSAIQNGYNYYNSAVFFDSYNNMWLLILQDANNQQNVNIMLNGSIRDSLTANAYQTSGNAIIRCSSGHPSYQGIYISYSLASSGISSYQGILPAFSNWNSFLEYVRTPYIPPIIAITSNGGGATHIAKRAGLLSSIGASNLSDILMVSGGGGGGLIIGEDTYTGKDAGGISGSGNNSANQTTGYAFGQGESGTGVSGGGGGLYGGYKGAV